MSFDCQPQRFLFTGEEVFTLGEWGETETYSGSIVSFEGTETTAIKSLIANITPQQSGSGDPSPSNVRPISGYDEVKVEQRGKNLLDLSSLHQGNMDGGSPTANVSIDCIAIKGGQNYTLNSIVTSGRYIRFYDSQQVELTSERINNYSVNPIWNFTAPNNASYLRVAWYQSGGLTTETMIASNPQLELGSTTTAYEPYQGTSYPISLGQTVYGGTLEVMSGKLTIDKGMVELGSLTWTKETNSNRFSASIPNTFKQISGGVVINAICSMYKVTSRDYVLSTNNSFSVHYSAGANYLNIHDDNAYSTMTAEQFKTYLNGQTLVCELQNPTTITLTPTQVTTLLGNNNIWADSGSVEVEIGENPYILVNPTKFEACPIFEVEGAGTLSIGDTTLTISNTGTTIIDTEMMEAYEDDNGAIISRNDEVEGGFPTLNSGVNTIEADGLTSVKITPKFWEL